MTLQDGTPAGGGTGLALPEFLSFVPPTLFRGVVAVVVLLVAYYLSKLTRRVLGRRVARRFRRQSVTQTVLRTIQTLVILLGAFIGLGVLGIRLGDLTISLSVFSAVLGIVLAPLVGSLINGVFILTEQPYEIGDMIHLPEQNTYGFVEDITLRYTKVFTLDNTFLVVPNGAMRDRDVVNFSAEDSRTRLSLDLLVTYESDIEEARRLIERAARQVDRVIEGGPDIRIGGARYPAAPTCYIDAYADHGVNLRLRYWAEEPYKLLTLRSRVQTNVGEALVNADVEFAYPHSHLVFDDTSGELQVNARHRGPDEPRPDERATKRRREDT
ncbi:mechanosensitive ion channel family protein [Halosegnis sp.]|uniref:mechanosensitive ion channel family protein n=1 Tax=Halosegnis sp. TaxID=2864959 RepID=UPI0035D40C4A